ncbi:zinc-binding dehydrogenase [SAR86 cluster bacterium]|jgi:S-(hydroxymethyl)glutathione dehydrogenase/alcohol dehydrogenase|nr:zinc-binding dehydrogenase [SAR86 cluster bacterium]
MKAAILVESKKPLVIDDVSLPERLSYGQVHVKLNYTSICGAQINEIDAVKGKDNYLPHLLGHEASGEVLEIGEGVSTIEVGDHVVLHWRPSKGIQSQTPEYKWNNKKVNAGWVTTFNNEAFISENRLTSIPKDFNTKLAPLFGCAVTTAFGVVNNDAQIKVGQSLIVFGLGGVGLNIIQAASMVSANPIIGVDLLENKIEMAKNFGLTHGINSSNLNLEEEIKRILKGNSADVVIETTGLSKVIESAYKNTNKDGKTILVGVPKKGDNISIYSLPLHFNKILKGSEGGQSKPDEDIPRLINLMDNDKMTLDGIITNEFELEDINKALDLFREGSAGRILIKLS